MGKNNSKYHVNRNDKRRMQQMAIEARAARERKIEEYKRAHMKMMGKTEPRQERGFYPMSEPVWEYISGINRPYIPRTFDEIQYSTVGYTVERDDLGNLIFSVVLDPQEDDQIIK